MVSQVLVNKCLKKLKKSLVLRGFFSFLSRVKQMRVFYFYFIKHFAFFFFFFNLQEASYPTVAATFVLLSRPSRHQLLNLYHEQLLGSACTQQTHDQNTLKSATLFPLCLHVELLPVRQQSGVKMCARVNVLVLHTGGKLKLKAVNVKLDTGAHTGNCWVWCRGPLAGSGRHRCRGPRGCTATQSDSGTWCPARALCHRSARSVSSYPIGWRC